MKTFIISLLSVAIFSIVAIAYTSPQGEETKTFKVYGNCEMCKKKIDGSLKRQGIKSANWNVDTKMMTVTYDAQKYKEEDLHKLIASTGYDTEKVKGDDKAYNSLPGCCQYDRK